MLALTALTFSAWGQGTLTTLYNFAGGNSGANPENAVLSYSNGTLVGTAPYDGAGGFGTVYQLTPGTGGTWTQTVLYSFKGGTDGALPSSALTLGRGAVLYGTTSAGGSSGAGTVFQLTPPVGGGAWTETVLYTFTGSPDGCGTTGQPACDGAGPLGGVIIGTGGALFGTTFGGGSVVIKGVVTPTGAGTVFQLTKPTGGTGPWTEKLIYNFQGGKDGSGPQSALIDKNGVLFGTTCCGTEGTVFDLREATGTWTKNTVYSFAGYPIGAFPTSLIIDANGVLYGSTTSGGTGGMGIVFSLTQPTTKGKPWTLATIHNYTGGTDGGSPYGALVLGPKGVLYGTVTIGGTYGSGAVVEFTPPASAGNPWTETVPYNFVGISDGSQPDASLILGANNTLYGTTAFGGSSGYGTVFSLVP